MYMTIKLNRSSNFGRFGAVAAIFAMAGWPQLSHAQLVPDGGTAVVDGVTTNLSGDLIVGTNSGPTLLVITNAGVVSNMVGTIGMNPGANSNQVRVSGVGSGWFNTSDIRVGDRGSYNLLVAEQGAMVQSLVTYLGVASTAISNQAVVTGAGTHWTNQGFGIVGFVGSGSRLAVESGARFDSATLLVAFSSESSNNIVEVTGTGSRLTTVGALNVGDAGPGNRLVVSDSGIVQVGTSLVLGKNAGSTRNRIVVSGGTLSVTNSTASGLLDIRRGTNIITAGSLQADRIVVSSGGSLQLQGGTVTTRALTNFPISALHVGDGVSAATLHLTGNGTHFAAGGVQVNASGRLLATGTLNGNVTVATGGTLEPGVAIGRLNVGGGVSLASGSASHFQVNKASATNDVLAATGSVALGGTLVLTNLGGTLAEGDQFKLLSASSISGAFSSVVAELPGPGLKWSISRIPVDGVLRVVSAENTATINQFEIQNGSHCVVCAVGGVPYDPVILLSSTNMLAPISSWQRVETNFFDVAGGVHFTNVLVTPDQQRYYRLLVE